MFSFVGISPPQYKSEGLGSQDGTPALSGSCTRNTCDIRIFKLAQLATIRVYDGWERHFTVLTKRTICNIIRAGGVLRLLRDDWRKSIREVHLKMRSRFFSTATLFWSAVGILGSAPMFAHHSFAAEYDVNKPVTVKGTVTKVEC